MAINIIKDLLKQYLNRFPDATFDNFKTYLSRNYPAQYTFLKRTLNTVENSFNSAKSELKNTTKQIEDTGKKVVEKGKQKTQQGANAMREALERNNITTKDIKGKASNIIKGAAKGAGKIASKAGTFLAPVQGLSDLPRSIQSEINKDNSRPLVTWGNRIQGTGDVLSALGLTGRVPAPIGVGIGGMLQGAGATMQGIDRLRNEGVDQNLIKNYSLKGSPQENQDIIDTYNSIQESQKLREQGDRELAEANELQDLAQQTLADNQEAQNYFANFNNRIANNIANLQMNNQQLRAVEGPGSSVNYNSGTSRPITNSTPINGSPTSGNYQLGAASNVPDSTNQPPAIRDGNGGTIQNPPTTEGNMENPQVQFNNNSNDLLNRVNMMSAFVAGARMGNQLPDIGVSQDELDLMKKQLADYGTKVNSAVADIEAYKQALVKDDRANSATRMMGALGNIISNIQPKQRAYDILPNGTTFDFGAPQQTNYDELVDRLVKQPGAADRFAKQVELNKQLLDLNKERIAQQQNLIGAAEISNATGLPLNVTMNMKPADYFGYLKEIQTTNRDLAKQGLSDVGELTKDYYQQGADYNKALALQQLVNQGNLSQEQLKQYGAGVRLGAQLETQAAISEMENNIKAKIAQLDNNTKLQVSQLVGQNALELEKLKQSDPNAYYRALGSLGNLLESGIYMSNPNANKMYNQLINNLLNNSQSNIQPLSNKQQAAQIMSDMYNTEQ